MLFAEGMILGLSLVAVVGLSVLGDVESAGLGGGRLHTAPPRPSRGTYSLMHSGVL